MRGTWKSAAAQIVIGCVIAGGMLWGLEPSWSGRQRMRREPMPPRCGKLLPQILIPAVAVSLLEEWLFRGLLLGLWLRFARPAAACLGTSLLFAFPALPQAARRSAHPDPAHALAGFELLGKILLHFTDPLFFVTDFATLLGSA